MELDSLEEIQKLCENTLAQSLGIVMTRCEEGYAEATMPVDARTHQPMGILHGGASVALAETVASIGGNFIAMKSGGVCVGLEINANHVRSVSSGLIKACAKAVHLGRTTQVWEIHITNEQGQLICTSRCTLAVKGN